MERNKSRTVTLQFLRGIESRAFEVERRREALPGKMSNQSKETSDNSLSKLLAATNNFHVDDEFSSKFKASSTVQPKFTPNNLIKKMAAIERNSGICAKDCRFLVKFYLHSTSSSRFSVTSEGHEEYEKLVKKYGVDKKAKGDNITLHRIAASFPIVAVTILRQFKIDRKFTTEMLKAKDAEKFPWSMRTQMCLSLAPIGGQYVCHPDHHNLIFGIVAYMYYENRIVTDPKKDVPPSATFEIVLNIAHAVYKYSNVDDEMKKDAWNHVVYDYNDGRESVYGLLKHFTSEIPSAWAAFRKRFEFRDPIVAPKPRKYHNKSAHYPKLPPK